MHGEGAGEGDGEFAQAWRHSMISMNCARVLAPKVMAHAGPAVVAKVGARSEEDLLDAYVAMGG